MPGQSTRLQHSAIHEAPSLKGVSLRKWQAHEIHLRNHRILGALNAGIGLADVAQQFELSEGHVAHIAREAQFTPKHQSSPDDSLSERDRFILALALHGETFSAIARDFGVSRERVRQIVKKRGGISARGGLLNVRADARRTEAEKEARRLADSAPHISVMTIAERTSLSATDVEELLGQAECIRRRAGRPSEPTVGDDDIFEELRRLSRLPGGHPLSANFYDQHRRAESVTSIRILQRFGTWRQACSAAGVQAHEPVRTYSSRWSDDQLLSWVRSYLAASTSRPTYTGLDDWLRQQSDAPSAQTIRNRYGTWTKVLKATLP